MKIIILICILSLSCYAEDSDLDVCEQPIKTGPCKASIKRWAFDSSKGRCVEFIYGGCQGNDNNFESKQDCKTACALDICDQPIEAGPCLAIFPRWAFDSTKDKCVNFTYGGCQGNDNNFETKEECKELCSLDICDQPIKAGPCFANFPRWAFDSEKDKCVKFTYGGCQGNDNNFETRKECKETCASNSDVCDLPIKVGPCKAAFRRWAFDSSKGKCVKFIYGGCKGNGNNFECKQKCQENCEK